MSSMTLAQQIITIGMCILGTIATRYLPFFIFKENKKTPEYIQYLGKFLPSAVFGMLVIYCLKNVEVLHGTHGIPEGISILVTAVLHLWKKNMFLSIAGGTICYMLMTGRNWELKTEINLKAMTEPLIHIKHISQCLLHITACLW